MELKSSFNSFQHHKETGKNKNRGKDVSFPLNDLMFFFKHLWLRVFGEFERSVNDV